MCAIAGIFGSSDPALVTEMLQTLRHRGPDDSHLISGSRFTLGASRLSIMDVAEGRQPVVNEDGTVYAAQNGELYNYPEIKPFLLTRGHLLSTGCDTEILPHLYEEYGTDIPHHLQGMFAVALWDDQRQRGILVRDRMGKKPLYYTERDGTLYFASEIKALLKVPGFVRELNPEAAHHFLGLKHVPHPQSIFKGIYQLPPAHSLIYEPGRPVRLSCFWKPAFSQRADEKLQESALVDQLLDLLKTAVRQRLMADVPIGFFLSGGLDSSLIVALATEIAHGEIQTFTLTYDGQSGHSGKDEDKRWARFVAEKYKTNHQEETTGHLDFPQKLRSILRHFDEPFSGVVATYFLSELMHRHVKVAISGDGADELFGSYLSHRLALPLANFAAYQKNHDPSLIPGFAHDVATLEQYAGLENEQWRARLVTFSEEEKAALYTDAFRKEVGAYSTDEYFKESFKHQTARDPLNSVLEAEFKTLFPDQVLTFVDRLSMAHSLEVRSPFLDTDVVNFVSSLPGEWKIRNGVTKYLLKQAARRYFPDEMVDRKKEGFIMPIAQWLSTDLEPYVRQTLDRDKMRALGIFSPEAVQSLVNRLYATPNPHYKLVNQVYALVVFAEWAALYLK